MSRSLPKVLYIIGWGRSGTTLIDNLLGQLPGVFATGELRSIWSEGLIEDQLCGCREKVRDCAVWHEVLECVAHSQYWPGSPQRVVEWQRRFFRTRHTLRVLREQSKGASREEVGSYFALTCALYRCIGEATGSRAIVNSSKVPSEAAAHARMEELDVYFLHMVRDPRASAYSWRRHKRRLDRSSDVELPRYSVAKNATDWLTFNVAAERIKRIVPPNRWHQLRYEDFVREPREQFGRIMRFVGIDDDDPFVSDSIALLTTTHTVSGNPNRFRSGETLIVPDDEWVRMQSTAQRLVSTALTVPLLRRYGYPIGVARPGGRCSKES